MNKPDLLLNPSLLALAGAIIRFYELGEQYFIPHLVSEKKNIPGKTW